MPPKTSPYFFTPRRIKIIILVIMLIVVLLSLTAYSVNLYVSPQNIVRGGSAEYHFDAGAERVRVARLLLSGDMVEGASLTCSKPRLSTGFFTVSVEFSNGIESVSAKVTTYQGVGGSFTVEVYFPRPISYYPSPVLYAEVYKEVYKT